ncbi:MAG: acetate--CoA ligase [Candidatus Thiodiazotropha sp.]
MQHGHEMNAKSPAFDWSPAWQELGGLPHGGGINMAHEIVDRHALSARGDQLALRWLSRNGNTEDLSYRRLRNLSNRFANLLNALGVVPGERVFCVLGRVPDLFVAALGSWKNRSAFCALFAAYGPEPLCTRLQIGEARVLVTSAQIYNRKIAHQRDQLPNLEFVLITGDDTPPEGTLSLKQQLESMSEAFTIAPTDADEIALVHFTSGTTGRPKGALHAHAALVAHRHTARLALDLRPGDVYWCTADPGWVTGISYGMIAPLALGARILLDEGDFDVERWYRQLQEQSVNVWYTAPTALRMMMKYGVEVAHKYDLSGLRYIASVGEPLNSEAVHWSQTAFNQPVHDTWWQTETGAIMIANYKDIELRPGSMGRPLPGIEAALFEQGPDGRLEALSDGNARGQLALRCGWPSMFRGYIDEASRYQACFYDGWYLSGDLARRDEAGYYWFIGRADDVIKSAGHLIGPFEVERTLLAHPAVLEAGVVGIPDPILGESVKAFVVLRPGNTLDAGLTRDLMAHARKRLGPAVAPRSIEARDELPKTRSGKIMRRRLRAQELGQADGDL